MMDLSKSQPQSVVDGVMIPSLLHGGDKECTAASVELVSRVAKSLPTEQVTRFIGVLLAGEGGGSGGGTRVSISEQSLVLFKSLLSLKKLNLPTAPHVEELIGWFERCLQSNENVMSKSMKLASAVHVLITKHLKKRNDGGGGGGGGGGGSSSIGGIHDHVGRVESLVTKLNTFMTKSSLAALNRLK